MIGHLFFLKTGFFFGFRKPLTYIPVECVVSVSYANVMKRTFDLCITYASSEAAAVSFRQGQDVDGDEVPIAVEFCMIDQDEHPQIDRFIQQLNLTDESMSEKRKARSLNINPGETGSVANGQANLDLDDDDSDPDDPDYESPCDSDGNPLGSEGSDNSGSDSEDSDAAVTVDEDSDDALSDD